MCCILWFNIRWYKILLFRKNSNYLIKLIIFKINDRKIITIIVTKIKREKRGKIINKIKIINGKKLIIIRLYWKFWKVKYNNKLLLLNV